MPHQLSDEMVTLLEDVKRTLALDATVSEVNVRAFERMRAVVQNNADDPLAAAAVHELANRLVDGFFADRDTAELAREIDIDPDEFLRDFADWREQRARRRLV